MKKPQFSKVLTIIALLLFIVTLVASFGFMFYISIFGEGQIIDFVVASTSLGIVGGILGLTFKAYFSKSSLENTSIIRNDAYKNVMKTRLEYIEEVIKLRQKYGIDQDVINEIEADSPFDELADAALNQMIEKMDSNDAEDSQNPDIQSF